MNTWADLCLFCSACGAACSRVDNVRLGGDLAPTNLDVIDRALLEHKVIFFRGQDHLTEDVLYEFAQLLGTPTTPHPRGRFA